MHLRCTRETLSPQAIKKVKAILLSDTTIQRRIVDMTTDIENQVVKEIKEIEIFCDAT